MHSQLPQPPRSRSARAAAAHDPADGLTPRQREADFIAGHVRDRGAPDAGGDRARLRFDRPMRPKPTCGRWRAQRRGCSCSTAVPGASACWAQRWRPAIPNGNADAPAAAPAPPWDNGEATLLHLPLIGRVAAGSSIPAQAHVEATYPADALVYPPSRLPAAGARLVHARRRHPRRGPAGRSGRARGPPRPDRGGPAWGRGHGQAPAARRALAAAAANPEVADILVRPGDAFAIEGVVVGSLRPQGWD